MKLPLQFSCWLLMLLGSISTTPALAQEVIQLWQGKAPGSESWSITETVVQREAGGFRVADVTTPTLTVHLPDPSRATGTAVVIAPGGGMVALGIPDYETGPAKWFNDRGIAAFILKYRVLPTPWQTRRAVPAITDYPRGNANPFPEDAQMTQVIEMGIADAQQALRIVRKNAANWGIDPSKVGMLGYSAGGGVAIGAAVTDAPGAQPDFIISAYGPSLVDVNVPDEPPPIFLAVKQYHPNVARALVALYEEWTNAGAPAELHIYGQLGPVPFLEDTGEWLGQAYVWMTKRDFAPQAPTAAEVDDAALPAAEGGDRQ